MEGVVAVLEEGVQFGQAGELRRHAHEAQGGVHEGLARERVERFADLADEAKLQFALRAVAAEFMGSSKTG